MCAAPDYHQWDESEEMKMRRINFLFAYVCIIALTTPAISEKPATLITAGSRKLAPHFHTSELWRYCNKAVAIQRQDRAP